MHILQIMKLTSFYTILALALLASANSLTAQALTDWTFRSQRTAIEPKHWIETDFLYQGKNTLAISGEKDGHDNGSWVQRVGVRGGSFVEFTSPYFMRDINEPHRSVITTIIWLDSLGKQIGTKEFPAFRGEQEDGWSKFQQVYQVPDKATALETELTYRWDADGKVFFAPPQYREVEKIPAKMVKLAAVHHKPRGSTTEKNLDIFGDFARKAGEKGADIVCLPEGMTLVGTGKNYVEASETVPGPTSEYLGKIAKEQEMYIVAGILEKEGDIVYNTAILLDRQGELAGKYRKVCLPREEIEGGVSPGSSFPVFETDFGTIGIMICWDVSFPEPARQLALQGANIILLPIWGGNIDLAKARAIENQIYLVSSTYDMKTGIFDLEGALIGEATDEDPVVVVEVDLNQQKLWPWLGEFKNRITQEMPGKKALEEKTADRPPATVNR